MKDQRLTARNLKLALDELGSERGDTVRLYFHKYLTIQAIGSCSLLPFKFEMRIVSEDEIPTGYDEELDALTYFPWAGEVDGRRMERDGTYDIAEALKVYGRADDCGNACAHVEPYGWVPECGCPVHDSED